MNPDTKKIALIGVFSAFAIIAGYIEFLFPISVGVPGIKIGFGNIIVLVMLYLYGKGVGIFVSLVKVIVSGLLFSSFSVLLYSLSGAAASIIIMIVAKKLSVFSPVGVSVAGGVFHNLGQLAVATIVLSTTKILSVSPILIISGVFAGFVTGLISVFLLKYLEKQRFISSYN